MNYLQSVFLILFLSFAQIHFASVHTIVPSSIGEAQFNEKLEKKGLKKFKKRISQTAILQEAPQKKPKNKWRIFTILMVPSLALTVIAAALPYLPALILFYIAGVLFITALVVLLAMSIPPIKKRKKKTTEPITPVEKTQ